MKSLLYLDTSATKMLARQMICIFGLLLLFSASARGQDHRYASLQPEGDEQEAIDARRSMQLAAALRPEELPQKLRTTVSLHLEEATLERALRRIAAKAGLDLFFASQTVVVGKRLMLDLQQVSAYEAIQEVLKGTGLALMVLRGGQLVITEWPKKVEPRVPSAVLELAKLSTQYPWPIAPVALEVAPVSGTVTDAESGIPLPGVNVVVKGAAIGTATDAEGYYDLDVPSPQDTLVFSFIGYETQEVPVAGRSIIDVQLAPSVSRLEDVVVTALGIEREVRSLGYAVSELDAEEVSDVKTANVFNALSAQVPGLKVRDTGSDPGSTVLMTIRGQGSLTGNNQPLIVIDGIPVVGGSSNRGNVDFGNAALDISPSNVKSVSVLKGASAAALYGSRAANGVILITTKSGERAGQGIGASFNSTTMFNRIWLLPEYQNTFGAGERAGTDEVMDQATWGPRLDVGTKHVQWNSPLDAQGNPIPTPWVSYPHRYRDFFQTGVTATNNLAITGNNEAGYYRASISNMSNRGIVPNTDLYRNSALVSGGYNLTDKLEVSSKISYTKSNSNNRLRGYKSQGNPMYVVLRVTPNINIDDLRQYWMPGQEELQQRSHLPDEYNNPFFTVHENTNSFFRNRLTGYLRADYQFSPTLSLMVRTGRDIYSEEREFKRAYSSIEYPQGSYGLQKIYHNERNTDFLLSYDRQLNSDWYISLSAGGNRMQRTTRTSMQQTDRLVVHNVYNVTNAAAGTLQGFQYHAKKQINSLFGLGTIAYKDMIYLNVTGRNDWSSTLPEDNNSYFYPSVSLSVIASDLLGLPTDGFLSFAKVRANWAQVGNDTGPYQLRSTFDFGTNWGDVKRARKQFTLRNSQLKPEITSSYEVGADLRFLQNRLQLDVTYYHTSTRNQIITIPTTITSGYSGKIVNAGEIVNRGWEVQLSATPIDGALRWQTVVNFTRNTNEVVELVEGVDRFFLRSTTGIYEQVVEGGSMGDLYAEATWARVPEGPHKGAPLLDENGYPIAIEDWTYVGNYNPDFMVGFSNTLSFKNFRLNVLIDWRQGGVYYCYTCKNILSDGRTTVTVSGRDQQAGGLEWVDGNGNRRHDGMVIPGYIANGDGTYRPNDNITGPEDYYGSIYWDFDGRSTFSATYFKLREASLTYTFGPSIPLPWGVDNLYVGLIARNLLLITGSDGYDQGYDPESQVAPTGGFAQGVAAYSLPATRSYGFKLGFNF